MSYGLQVQNIDNHVQIDNLYPNMGLREKFTQLSVPNGYGNQHIIIDLSGYTSPVVAVDYPGTISFMSPSNSIMDPSMVDMVFCLPGTTRRNATFYVYDVVNFIKDNSSYGLELYDAQQNMVMDSRERLLRVVAHWKGNDLRSPFESITISGKKLLPVFSKFAFYLPDPNGASYRWTAATIAAGSVTRANQEITDIPFSGHLLAVQYSYDMLVIDATGH